MEKIKIWLWKCLAIVWDYRPRLHLPRYIDYPIASCDIADKYEYPAGYKILFEWDEGGKHWIVFSR
jgi:hypothetical protein